MLGKMSFLLFFKEYAVSTYPHPITKQTTEPSHISGTQRNTDDIWTPVFDSHKHKNENQVQSVKKKKKKNKQ